MSAAIPDKDSPLSAETRVTNYPFDGKTSFDQLSAFFAARIDTLTIGDAGEVSSLGGRVQLITRRGGASAAAGEMNYREMLKKDLVDIFEKALNYANTSHQPHRVTLLLSKHIREMCSQFNIAPSESLQKLQAECEDKTTSVKVSKDEATEEIIPIAFNLCQRSQFLRNLLLPEGWQSDSYELHLPEHISVAAFKGYLEIATLSKKTPIEITDFSTACALLQVCNLVVDDKTAQQIIALLRTQIPATVTDIAYINEFCKKLPPILTRDILSIFLSKLLNSNPNPEEVLEKLRALPEDNVFKITPLNLRIDEQTFSFLTDDFLQKLSECCPKVQELEITKAPLTKIPLAWLDTLQRLHLVSCNHFAFRNCKKLPPHLTSLVLINSNIDNSELEQLKTLSLTSLNLSNCDLITDAGLAHLTDLPLTSLNLSQCPQITDAGLAHLTGLPLTSLRLSWCTQITDAGLAHLTGLPLTSLNLSNCYLITDAGLAHLTGLPLTYLDLSWCPQITDAGLAHLTGLPLTSLALSRCTQITDAGLAHLTGLPLTSLVLFQCTQITDAGLDVLRATHPYCRFIR